MHALRMPPQSVSSASSRRRPLRMRTALALLLLLLRVTAAGADIAHEMRALVRDTLDAHTVDEPRTVISKQHDLSSQGLADGDPDDEDEQEEVIVVVNSISDSTTGRCPKRQKRAKGACTLHAAINKGLRLDKNLRPTISLPAGRIAISKALAVGNPRVNRIQRNR
eukprot:COSAG05_NODE_47_length_24712_cov_26.673844_7_plen_166_part_00